MMFKWIRERREAALAEAREAAQTLAEAKCEANEAYRRKVEARALATRLQKRKEENGFGPLLAQVFVTPHPAATTGKHRHKGGHRG